MGRRYEARKDEEEDKLVRTRGGQEKQQEGERSEEEKRKESFRSSKVQEKRWRGRKRRMRHEIARR